MSDLFTTRYAKFWTAILGFVVTLISTGALSDEWVGLANAIIAFVTALGVVAVPNTPPPGQAARADMSEQG